MLHTVEYRIRPLLPTFTLAIALVAACDFSQLPRSSNQQSEEQQQRTDPPGPPPGRVLVAQAPTAAAPTPARNEQVEPWYRNPDWWQVVLIVAGTLIATVAFLSEREAVRLTQRADVLLEGVGYTPRAHPSFLSIDTIVTLHFKNYGPTRASQVRLDAWLFIPSAPKPGKPPLPLTVIAGGGTQTVTFPPLGRLFDAETIRTASKGDVSLSFHAAIAYTDVFGRAHTARANGTYYGFKQGGFVIEENDAAS